MNSVQFQFDEADRISSLDEVRDLCHEYFNYRERRDFMTRLQPLFTDPWTIRLSKWLKRLYWRICSNKFFLLPAPYRSTIEFLHTDYIHEFTIDIDFAEDYVGNAIDGGDLPPGHFPSDYPDHPPWEDDYFEPPIPFDLGERDHYFGFHYPSNTNY